MCVCTHHTHLTVREDWAHWWDSGSSQPVSSFMVYSLVRSYSLIKSLHLLIEPRTCPLGMRMAALLLGAGSWQQTCLLTQAGFGAQKESPETQQGPKLKERQSSEFPSSFCMSQPWLWQRKSLCPRAFSDPLKVITWCNSSSHSLPHSLQGSGNKTWPEAVHLPPLHSLQTAKSTSLTIFFCGVCDQPGSLLQGMIRFQATVWKCQGSLENM